VKAEPFTIRMFVVEGDPAGVRIIDKMNWTGQCLSFPRARWQDVRNRPEFVRAGVYILSGYRAGEAELPTLYVGQADGVRDRIDSHEKQKDFWDHCRVFTSSNGGSTGQKS
jgi:hypothetical protein